MNKSTKPNQHKTITTFPFVLFFCLLFAFTASNQLRAENVSKDTTQWAPSGILNDVKFAKCSTQLIQTSLPALDKLADDLKKKPKMTVKLSAHTDELDLNSNVKLALSRAEEIKKYLVEKKGIKAIRIRCEGFGHEKQNLSNKAKLDQSKNQRIELFFALKEDNTANKKEESGNWAAPVVLDGVKFSNSSDILANSSLPVLNRLANDMLQRPNIAVKVIGHTNEADSTKSDVKLSLMRAEQIKKYLVEQKSINPSRIVCEGKGTQQPLYTSDSDRAKNRRIEICLKYIE